MTRTSTLLLKSRYQHAVFRKAIARASMQLQAIKLAQAGAGAKATHTSAMVGDFEKDSWSRNFEDEAEGRQMRADADEEPSDWGRRMKLYRTTEEQREDQSPVVAVDIIDGDRRPRSGGWQKRRLTAATMGGFGMAGLKLFWSLPSRGGSRGPHHTGPRPLGLWWVAQELAPLHYLGTDVE